LAPSAYARPDALHNEAKLDRPAVICVKLQSFGCAENHLISAQLRIWHGFQEQHDPVPARAPGEGSQPQRILVQTSSVHLGHVESLASPPGTEAHMVLKFKLLELHVAPLRTWHGS
jgi:hypothetical protein